MEVQLPSRLGVSRILRVPAGYAPRHRVTRVLAATGVLGVLIGIVAAVIPTQPAVAATGIHKAINFQGKLVANPNGTNIANGTYNMQFKLYTGGDGCVPPAAQASPCNGTLQWTESWLRNNSQGVTITDGVFQVNLGAVNSPLPAIFNDDTIWLSINLGNTNATCTPFSNCVGDGEMLPFIRFTAAPYALNSDLLDGLDSSAFAQLNPGSAQSGSLNVTGSMQAATSLQAPLVDTATAVALNVGTGTASSVTVGRATTPFTIQGNASSTITSTSGGNTTTVGFVTPTGANAINFPNAGGTLCTNVATTCNATYQAAGNYLAKNTSDTSSASFLGQLYGFSNNNSGAAGVLGLTNSGTNAALNISQTGNPSAGQAVILGKLTNASASGNLIDLLSGASGSETSKFVVDAAGNVAQEGGSSTTDTINGQRISAAANFTGTVTAATSVIVPLMQTADVTGASAALTVRSGHSTSSGNTGVLTIASGDATSGNSGNVSLDSGTASGTAGSVSVGTGAFAHTTTVGSTTGASVAILQGGTGTGASAAIRLSPANAGDINIGTTTQTGQITVGQSTGTNIISVGTANRTSATQTVNIGNGTSATSGGVAVNIANGVPGASTTNIVAIGTAGTTTGTVGITIGSIGAAAHTTVLQGGNGTGASAAIRLSPANAGDINIGTTTQTGQITMGQSTGTNTISIGTANRTSATQTVNIGNGTSATSGGVAVNIANGVPGASTTNTVAIGTAGTTTGTVGITIGSIGAAAHTTVIQGGNGTGASAAIRLSPANAGDINIGTTTQTGQIRVGQSTGTNTISIGTANRTSATQTVDIAGGTSATSGGTSVTIANGIPGASTTNTVSIGTGGTTTGTVGVTVGSIGGAAHTTTIQGGNGSGAVAINTASGGTLSVGNAAVASTIQIGNTTGAVTQNIFVGNNATASSITNTTIGSTIGTSTTTVQAGSGGIVLNAGTLKRTATGTTTIDLIDAGTTKLAVTNTGGGAGVISASTGYQINAAAALAGHYLRGDGTNFVDGTIQAADLPDIGASYIKNQTSPQATSNFNISATGIAGVSLLTPLLDTPSGTTTLNVGTTNATAGVNLNQSTTIAANKNLSLASGTGTFAQVYTGASDAHAITANSLSTGSALKVTSAHNSAANTAWNGVSLDVTNSQATTAVSTGQIAGLDLQFTQAPTINGNNETVANFAIKQTDSSVSDNTVNSIINVANNDTGTGSQVKATSGVLINGANVTNGLTFSGTFDTNLINTSTNNFTLTQGGVISAGTWQGSTVGVAYGGTGQTTYTDGQLLIGNTTGNTLNKATLTGTANRLGVTNGGGSITLNVDATQFPNSAGANTVLKSSGANAASWVSNTQANICSDCATTTLNNLGTTSINASLLTGAATIDLGSNANPFRDLYLGGTATDNFRFTGTASGGAKTVTLDNLSGKLALVQTAGSSTTQTGDLNVSGALLAPSHDTATAVAMNVGTATASSVTVGRATSSTNLTLQGSAATSWSATGASGTTTLAFAAPSGTTNLTIPTGTGTICTTVAATCNATYQAAGNYLVKNASDTSNTSFLGQLYTFTNSNSGAAGVLGLTNSGTNSALNVTQTGNPGANQALVFARHTNAAISGNLIDLQSGTSGSETSKFKVDTTGNLTVAGNYQFTQGGNRSLNIGQASSGAGNNLTVQAGQSGSGANNGGDLILQAGATGGSGTSGSVTVRSNVTNQANAFQVQSASSANMLNVNTTSNAVVIGQVASGTAASAALYFGDTCNNFTQTCLKIGENGGTDSDNLQLHGAAGLTFTTGFTSPATAGVLTATGRLGVGIGNTSPSAAIHVTGVTGAVDLLRITDSTATAADVFTIADEGAAVFKTRTDNANGFQVQETGGVAVLNVDTLNQRVAVRALTDVATANTVTVDQRFNNATYWTTCNSSGWTGTATTTAHTSGGGTTACISTNTNFTVTAGVVYEVGFTITGMTTGSVTPRIGGTDGQVITTNGTLPFTQLITAADTTNLRFTPHNLFNGTISAVTVRTMTASGSTFTVKNSNDTSALEVRTGGANKFTTALGTNAFRYNVSGSDNTVLGDLAMEDNTSGNNNTAIGSAAMQHNTNGVDNTAVGYGAQVFNRSGQGNTSLGALSNFQLAAGSHNTGLGYQAGYKDTDDFYSYDTTNATAVGAYAQTQASNTLILGGAGSKAVKVGIGTSDPTNTLSVSPHQYNSGTGVTATQSGNTVTASSSVFTTAMVGGEITWGGGGAKETITGFTSGTVVTASVAQTVSPGQTFRVQHAGLQVTSAAKVGVGTTAPTANFQVSTQVNTTTALQVQNSNSVAVLNVDTTNRSMTLAAGNGGQLSVVSDLTGGARSTSAVAITQANDATNNSTGALLDVNNSDTGSSGTVLNIQGSGTGNLLQITDNTATARDVLIVADGGATTFRNQTDSAAALRVQKADASATIFNVDTSSSRVGVNVAAPARELHVDGVVRVDRASNSAAFMLHRYSGVTPYKTFFFGVDATGSNAGDFFIGDYGTAVSGGGLTRRLTVDTNGTVIISGTQTDLTTANLNFYVDGDSLLKSLSGNSTNAFQVQTNGSATVFNVDTATSRVGIGLGTTPGQELEVNGDIRLDSNGTSSLFGLCHTGLDADTTFADRDIVACSGAQSGVNDYAEFYATDDDVTYGDLVTLSDEIVEVYAFNPDGTANKSKKVRVSKLIRSKSPNQDNIIGIVSNNYTDFQSVGRAVLTDDQHPMPVALSGRVPLKVSTEGGEIKVGDRLTSSSIPGVAMKATQPGVTVGYAMDGYANSDPTSVKEIVTFVNVSWYGLDTETVQGGTGQSIQNGSTSMDSLNVGGATTLNTLTVMGDANFKGKLTADTIQGSKGSLESINVTGEGKFGDVVVAGMTTTKDLVVTASAAIEEATVKSLAVTGKATVQELEVVGATTLADVTVKGSATFEKDINLAGVGQSRNAITKKFKASKDLHVGDVVIGDPAKDGQVTTTTTGVDTRVLGVALTDTKAGDDATIAIGGSVQVKTSASATANGDLLVSSGEEGKADKSAAPVPGSVIGKALGKPDADGLVWVLVTLN